MEELGHMAHLRSLWKSSTIRDQGDSEALDLRGSIQFMIHEVPAATLQRLQPGPHGDLHQLSILTVSDTAPCWPPRPVPLP